jgi:hypothetical protein
VVQARQGQLSWVGTFNSVHLVKEFSSELHREQMIVPRAIDTLREIVCCAAGTMRSERVMCVSNID